MRIHLRTLLAGRALRDGRCGDDQREADAVFRAGDQREADGCEMDQTHIAED